jgi:hypothetical protein
VRHRHYANPVGQDLVDQQMGKRCKRQPAQLGGRDRCSERREVRESGHGFIEPPLKGLDRLRIAMLESDSRGSRLAAGCA